MSAILIFSIAFIMIAPLQVIDVYAAVPSTMNAPTVSSKTDVSVTLGFTAPASDSSISDYKVKQSTDDSTFSDAPTPPGTALTESVHGLSADTTYYFKIAAVSSEGTGTYSASVEVKTLGVPAGQNYQGQGQQNFGAGKSFGEGVKFEAGQSFSAGTMTFGANQEFGAGSEFAAGQSFNAGLQDFQGTQTFGSGSTFAAGQSFSQSQSFTSGAQNFGAGTHFGTGTEFAGGQSFGSAQNFGDGTKFGSGTNFGATQTFSENMDFSSGTHTFTAAQEFKKGATFAAGQDFAAGVAHDFSDVGMSFGQGIDFGAARTFGASQTFTGTQNWDDDLHTFGEDPVFSGKVNFADNQVFPKGASFGAGQEFEAGEDYTFGDFMDFGAAPVFGKARTFGAGTYFSGSASSDMGGFANIFSEGAHLPTGQAFTAAQTFAEHMHFGENTDFTGAAQTFKAGAHFGDGTTFAVGQSLPTSVVPPFGLMLEAFSCLDATCIPADGDAYLAPGEFLTPGVDPDPIYSSITKDSKTIEMDGLGFAMEFNGDISTAGTIGVDPIDPATLPLSSASTDITGSRDLTADGGQYQTVGTVLDITMGTAVATGSMDITVEYSESSIPEGALEENLEVIHHTGQSWITEDTCTQDTENNKFTCTIDTLSPVGVGSPGSSATTSSGTCAQCKVLRTHGGFAINDSTYTLVKKYNDIDTNVVKTGEPVTITLSVPVADGASRVTSTIIYLDVYGSPNNYKHSPSISYSPNLTDKIAVTDHNGLWSSVDVESEVVQHPIHKTSFRTNYTFTMIFDKPMEGSHIVTETTNHYGIPEVLYVLDALDVVKNEGNYADEVELQEELEPEVIIQAVPEPEAVVEPKLVNDPEPVFMSDTITSLDLILDPEPIPVASAQPEQNVASELVIDPEPVLNSEPKQQNFFSWLASLFS